MTGLIDYASMTPKEFWELVDSQGVFAKKRVEQFFYKVNTPESLTESQAIDCLNSLFIDSHRRLKESYPDIYEHYPTQKILKNKLVDAKELWVMDHTTSSFSIASTLSFFSNQDTSPLQASSHFVIGYSGLPFYLVPLMHGALHEPYRQHDTVSITTVNAGSLSDVKGRWQCWAGQLPQSLVVSLPPVRCTVPYKGSLTFQPFTTDQIKNSVYLKRILVAALRRKIDFSRFTQHSDWRSVNSDMGPLWPGTRINEAAFDNIPATEYDFVQQYDSVVTPESLQDSDKFIAAEQLNPEFKWPEIDGDTLLTLEEIHLYLCKIGIKIPITNSYTITTKEALQKFQTDWNQKHPDDLIDTHGLPNIRTCKRLAKEAQ